MQNPIKIRVSEPSLMIFLWVAVIDKAPKFSLTISKMLIYDKFAKNCEILNDLIWISVYNRSPGIERRSLKYQFECASDPSGCVSL